MQRLIFLILYLVVATTCAGLASSIYNNNKPSLLLREAKKVSDINADVAEFINLLPKREIQGIFKAYVNKDKEIISNWDYVHSTIFQKLLSDVAISPEYNAVRTEFTKVGLSVEGFLAQLEGLFVWNSQSISPSKMSTGLRGMLLDSIRPLFPIQKFKLLTTQKFVFSSQFRKMLILITSINFKQKISLLVGSRSMRALEEHSRSRGVDVSAIYEFIASFRTVYNYLMQLS